MLVTELRDVENVFRFVEVVAVVAIREHSGVEVSGVRLVDVGDDLVVGGGYGKAAGLRGELGGFLVALVAVEDADRNVEVEADGVVGSCAVRKAVFAVVVVVGLERWGQRYRWRRPT